MFTEDLVADVTVIPAAVRAAGRRDIRKEISGDQRMVEAVVSRLDGAPMGPRRRWSDEFKERAVAASFAPGANISALARRLEIRASLLYDWRKASLKQRGHQPVCAADAPKVTAPVTSTPVVELVIGDATIRVGSEIGEAALTRILRAVRSA